ncbi:HAMP domain-containing histidine kinase [Ramlibacter sp. USB13]|uniref:histidine kinase n=1 Tax=Ramlibacter cellulosilyticus TaxID=2764187 RepID=A0A923MSB1_9BURK|nr:HAMP domain-containing sensor histidine kinase [Ramlibacter cellulosilyticus]MBC5784021.1 HAMP domain-containing histidine kinase [Ramlibacter cellulosilyticus]
MKLPDLALRELALEVPRLGLASFRRRILIRAVFLLLALATLALAVVLLQDEKERSLRNYQQNFRKTQADVLARLRQPAGQLALLNPYPPAEVVPLHPLVLPYPALDFDDPGKALQAADLAGCSTIYPDDSALCAGVGSNAYTGGFLYLVGSFTGGELVGRDPGEANFGDVHLARIRLEMRGEVRSWIAPFERQSMRGEPLVRGRLVAYAAPAEGSPWVESAAPLRDFRGWVWQSASCSAGGEPPDCLRRISYAIRLPVEGFRAALGSGRPAWPPPDLDRIRVHLQMFAPGGATVFDSNAAGAVPPATLNDLARLLQPGEDLTIRRAGSTQPLAVLKSPGDGAERTSPLILRLIDRLPVTSRPAPVSAQEIVGTPLGNYEVRLAGDAQGVARGLGVVATRMSWYVGAMLAAIALAWIVIEVGLIRRIAVLTRRAAAVSHNVQLEPTGDARIVQLDVSDLRGRDELGILAGGLSDLLQRVKSDVQREQVRAQRERDMLQAVGHEILSPLQSLMVLHPDPTDPAHRYVQRMQQAVRVLYGQASPSEALAAAQLELSALDLDAFLREVAENAAYAGIDDVRYDGPGTPLPVRADPFSLEDVVTHILRNAQRHRAPGTPITLSLAAGEGEAVVAVHNVGEPIPEALIGRIFDYGVSEGAADEASGRRGQGLFVARTYMAKMGGSVRCRNERGGVVFELALPLDG